MKKILTLLLVAALMLSLCACVSTGDNNVATTAGTTASDDTIQTGKFMVGYGKGDITPTKTGLKMLGGKTSLTTGFASYLYAICIAITDADGNTAIIMSVDTTSVSIEIVKEMEKYIADTYDIPVENFTISSIHQHCNPAWDDYYTKLGLEAMKKAVDEAMEDRAPAEMYINTVETKALNFVRHYYSKTTNTIVTDNYNEAVGQAEGYSGHVTEADNDMQLLKFTREDKDPVIVVNFGCHPINGYSSTDVHSDWVGVMRDKVEEKIDAKLMYISAAGGNLSSHTRIAEDLSYPTSDWKSHGEKAANYVIKAEDSYTKVNTGKIETKFITQEFPADHSMDQYKDIAKQIYDNFYSNPDKATEIYKQHSDIFSSTVHGYYVYQKSQMADTIDISVGVISIGDVAFSCHQYEMFDTNGVELKQGTVGNANYPEDKQMENPYAMTVVTTMAKGTQGYIPSAAAYAYGCYEADGSNVAAGSGELLVTSYLEILNELHGN